MFNYNNPISNYNLGSSFGSYNLGNLSSYNSNSLYGSSSSLYFSNNLFSSCPTCHGGSSNYSNSYISSLYRTY